MKRSMIAGVCAAAMAVAGVASAVAAETPQTKVFHPQMLPQLYVSADKAQAACPSDTVVWVNWSARKSHVSTDKYYGHTVTGAYACAAVAAAAGIKPAS